MNKIYQGAIGIDLGTTYSCVGVYRNGQVEIINNDAGNRTMPSYVSFTDTERLIGDAAKNHCVINPSNTVFDVKRMIGRSYNDKLLQQDIKHFPFKVVNNGGKPAIKVKYLKEEKTFAPEEISAMVLGKMKKCAEDYLGEKVTKAVITVPAYFNDAQRQATKDAGAIAGLEVLRIINEPTAAAIAYGLDKKEDKEVNVLIYDLGGGTLDVSLLSIENGMFEVKSTNGNVHLGGEDFDNKLVEYCMNDFKKKYKVDVSKNPKSIRRLRTACEKAKRQLSSSMSAIIDVDGLCEGHDCNITISRSKFEQLCADLFKKCLEPVTQVFIDSKMDKKNIDDVVLVGGSTRIPKIQEMLKDFFDGKELCKSVNPDEAVAYGAAIQANILSIPHEQRDDRLKNVLLVDVTPLSLGIETRGEYMTVMIPRNTIIPCRKEDEFSTGMDNQPGVTIKVFEGERPYTKDNRYLGQFDVKGLPPAKRGDPNIKIIYDVDANGILTVTAELNEIGKKGSLKIENNKESLTKAEIERMIKDAENYKEEDEKVRKSIESKNKLDTFIYNIRSVVAEGKATTVNEDDKKKTLEQIEEFQTWLESHQNEPHNVYEQKFDDLNAIYKNYVSRLLKNEPNKDIVGIENDLKNIGDMKDIMKTMTEKMFGKKKGRPKKC